MRGGKVKARLTDVAAFEKQLQSQQNRPDPSPPPPQDGPSTLPMDFANLPVFPVDDYASTSTNTTNQSFSGIFATHHSVEEGIKALAALSNPSINVPWQPDLSSGFDASPLPDFVFGDGHGATENVFDLIWPEYVGAEVDVRC